MYKKTVTYTDYSGMERTEDFYFNLTAAELTELKFSVEGGLDAYLERIINANSMPAIIKEFKHLVLLAYGEKDETGKYFNKSKEISDRFSHTEAYSQIFMELSTNEGAATEFINAIVPHDAIAELDKKLSRQNVAPES